MFNLAEIKSAVEARRNAYLGMQSTCLKLADDIRQEIAAGLAPLTEIGINVESNVDNLGDSALISWVAGNKHCDGMIHRVTIRFDDGAILSPNYGKSPDLVFFARIADEPSVIVGKIARDIKERFLIFVEGTIESNLEEENAA